eukprot:GILJ01003937.1.p1 GENE.GILJ01003937.1~~GILJ01003937.1.p1  ORF type:complete len:764 (-),score=122.22 GILJ01003937.1:165-2456(-)
MESQNQAAGVGRSLSIATDDFYYSDEEGEWGSHAWEPHAASASPRLTRSASITYTEKKKHEHAERLAAAHSPYMAANANGAEPPRSPSVFAIPPPLLLPATAMSAPVIRTTLPLRPEDFTRLQDSEFAKEFQRIIVTTLEEDTISQEISNSCKLINDALNLRTKYIMSEHVEAPLQRDTSDALKRKDTLSTGPSLEPSWNPFEVTPGEASNHAYKMKLGVFRVYADAEAAKVETDVNGMFTVNSVETFYRDLNNVMKITHFGECKSLCFKRLQMLEARFKMHQMFNSDKEMLQQKQVPHRDFYNVRKVDTHVHHSACMNQKHLLRFIKKKLKTERNELVYSLHGKAMSMEEVFNSLKLTAYDLSVDSLDMQADLSTFHRFDRFNLKYNPFGQTQLREIFLKTDNYIQGRYLAEVTAEVMSDLEANKYQFCEYRISIYGRKITEWQILSRWFVQNKIWSKNVRWLIQIPRLYEVYKRMGAVSNFADMINNIFEPLFAATKDPTAYPDIHMFLQQVVGFDSVDDESIPERRMHKKLPHPEDWNLRDNPPYSYWSYYLYANMVVLNQFRASRGMNTFTFRPHAGESGGMDHLGTAFLLANSINHGIVLRKTPVLQYLFYLAQIGLAMSPLSNNRLFLEYDKNPFPIFFARGLNVSLSTDDPLQIHYTKEPLLEEYSVAAQVWKFASTDMCEIARNSVLQSGFEHHFKSHWLSPSYVLLPKPEGNDITKTNLPNIRAKFRYESLADELKFVTDCAGQAGDMAWWLDH